MKDWEQDDSNINQSRNTSSLDYTVIAGLAVGAAIGTFSVYKLIRSTTLAAAQAKKSSQNFYQQNQAHVNNFSSFSKNAAENVKNSAKAAQNIKRDDFSKENFMKSAEKLKQQAQKQAKSVDSKTMENLLKDAVKSMEAEARKQQQKQTGSKSGNGAAGQASKFFVQFQKRFNTPENNKKFADWQNEMTKKMEQGFKEMDKKMEESFDKSQKSGSVPGSGPVPKTEPKKSAKATPSAFDSFMEENFGSLFDKHLEGGFEDVGKKGMSLTEARRILQFEVNGPPPSKQNIMDNFRHLSRVNHPDMGGSAFLSAKVNEAKEVLLKENKRVNRGRR